MAPPLPPWSWRGAVAVVLAVAVAVSVSALSVGAVTQDSTISPQGAAVLNTALGTLIGAVATYLGGAFGDHPTPPNHDQTTLSGDNRTDDDGRPGTTGDD